MTRTRIGHPDPRTSTAERGRARAAPPLVAKEPVRRRTILFAGPATAALAACGSGESGAPQGAGGAALPPTQVRLGLGSSWATPERMDWADAVLFDGTLYRDDEMIKTRTGSKTGRRMGHMSIAGQDGSLAALAKLRARRIYIHINNTNPILVEGSPERTRVTSQGWEIAEDGQEIVL